MNKKDAAEIKKNFTDDSGYFTVNNVLTAFIDAEKRVLCKEIESYISLSQDEGNLILATLKKVVSGNLGKTLVEYRFPNAAYDEGGAQKLLYSAVQSKLGEEETDKLIERLTSSIDYASPFAIICAHCTYSVFSKDKNDEKGLSRTATIIL